jgi:hypothetical protein
MADPAAPAGCSKHKGTLHLSSFFVLVATQRVDASIIIISVLHSDDE